VQTPIRSYLVLSIGMIADTFTNAETMPKLKTNDIAHFTKDTPPKICNIYSHCIKFRQPQPG